MKLKTCPWLVVSIKYLVLSFVGGGIWLLGFNTPQVLAETKAVDFYYDALGQRIAKIDSEGDNTYYISPNLEIVVSKDGVVKTRKNYYFNGKLASVREQISSKAKTSSCTIPQQEFCDGRDNDCDWIVDEGLNCAPSLYNIHQDHLGSTSLITNDKGEVVSQEIYYPYGETRSQISDIRYWISDIRKTVHRSSIRPRSDRPLLLQRPLL